MVGPTGCGKSTTLGLVSGLDRPSAGTVRVGEHTVDGIAAGTSFMFQADALMPWKTVLSNVTMGPLFHGVPKKEARALATDWCRRARGPYELAPPAKALPGTGGDCRLFVGQLERRLLAWRPPSQTEASTA